MSKRPVAQLIHQADQAGRGGDHAKAAKLLQRALKVQPGSTDLVVRLGDALIANDQAAEACGIIRKALGRAPNDSRLLAASARAARAAGRLADALAAARTLVDQEPHAAAAWHLLGQIQFAAADAPGAYLTLRRAHELDPENASILGLLAEAQLTAGIFPVPMEFAELAVARQPRSSRNQSRLGNGYRLNNRFEDALEAFDEALRIDRTNLEAIAGKADVLESLGDTEAAIDLLKPRVVTGQTSFLLLSTWARLCRRTKQPEQAIGPLEQFLAAGRSTVLHRSNLLIQLGQLYEKVGRYDDAFTAWTLGNRAHRGRWNREDHEAFTTRIMTQFSPRFLEQCPRGDHDNRQPVFVVGMYRSGTTLTEQILSSHPAIRGAGELGRIHTLIYGLPERLGTDTPYPECAASLAEATLRNLADDYSTYVRELVGDADRITDKMPMNYINLGLIHLMFPDARIIHCTRNPLDTCLSCYGNAFSSLMAYTADLSDLGHAYRQYQRLMAHWHTIPSLSMIELNYETLITDPEPSLRRVLEFLDVPWDESCLRFHESTRINITPSVDQVREPLYRGSIGRAAHYDAHLGPLKTALGGA